MATLMALELQQHLGFGRVHGFALSRTAHEATLAGQHSLLVWAICGLGLCFSLFLQTTLHGAESPNDAEPNYRNVSVDRNTPQKHRL